MASTTAIQAAQDFVEEHYGPAIAERSEYTMDIATLLDRFAADAVREEREACAKAADGWRFHKRGANPAQEHGWEQAALTIAATIRVRSDGEEGR